MEADYTYAVCDVISPYQRVSILQSKQFGRVLTLDDDVSKWDLRRGEEGGCLCLYASLKQW